MLIDDDDVTLMICKMRLLKSGFCEEVYTFESAEAALDFFDEQKSMPEGHQKLPDLIFLDLNMPGMDGWEFIEEFGKIYHTLLKPISILILSSSVDPDDAERASFEPLILGFITKPLTEQSLDKFKNTGILDSF